MPSNLSGRFLTLWFTAFLLAAGCPLEQPSIDTSLTEIQFGTIARGHPRTIDLLVQNDGESLLVVQEVWIEGGNGFSASTQLDSLTGLGPGDRASVQVVFDPANEGYDSGVLMIRSTAANTPSVQIPLSGFGSSSRLRVEPNTLSFEEAIVGASSVQEIRIYSEGEAPLELLGLGFETQDGLFGIASTTMTPGSQAEVVPGSHVLLEVLYAPLTEESSSNALLIVTNDPEEPTVRVPLSGSGGNNAPFCQIVGPNSLSLLEGASVSLEATVYDDFSSASDLAVRWFDRVGSAEREVVCLSPEDGAPGPTGFVTCTHIPEDLGLHELVLEVTDGSGRSCTDTHRVELLRDQPPEVVLTTPETAGSVGDGSCVSMVGVALDEGGEGPLPIQWSSDRDGLLLSTTTEPDGTARFNACDLSCGTHVLSLQATDERGQVGSDSVSLTVAPVLPSLGLLSDLQIVEGQTLSVEFSAAASCGIEPTITWDGTPPGSSERWEPVGFDYTPTYSPEDNPVGERFEVRVEATLTWEEETLSVSEAFWIEVLSNEFLVRSTPEGGVLQFFWSDYAGGFSFPDFLPLEGAPRAVVDIDGDGDFDLVVGRGLELSVWQRQADGSFVEQVLGLVDYGPLSTGDFDGDGLVDFASYDEALVGITYLNRSLPGDLLFEPVPVSFSLGGVALGSLRSLSLAALDVDGDGLDELHFSSTNFVDSWIAEVPNLGGGVFGAAEVVHVLDETSAAVQAIDAEGDGDVDLLVGFSSSGDPGQVILLRRTGGLLYEELALDLVPGEEIAGSAGAGTPGVYDHDHDGCPDVVVDWRSYADPTIGFTTSSLGLALGRSDGEGACTGTFGTTGSGEDTPLPFWATPDAGALRGPFVVGG